MAPGATAQVCAGPAGVAEPRARGRPRSSESGWFGLRRERGSTAGTCERNTGVEPSRRTRKRRVASAAVESLKGVIRGDTGISWQNAACAR